MGLFAVLSGLFGCSKAKPARHTVSEISVVSVYCGHMDHSCSYCFSVRREQDRWLLDADCFTHGHNTETELEKCEVGNEDIDALFEIIQSSNLIAHAENYKKPRKSRIVVLDETTFGFSLTFTDGSQYMTDDCQPELRKYFYAIAERYGKSEAQNTDIG
ncbi:MAG: hypothetical protein PUC05_01685 [Firmicutes bacterium]|nr:hypothetical protein [Bacillota bacterium]